MIFRQFHERGELDPGIIDDFPAWMAQMEAVPLRALGLRQVYRIAASSQREALKHLDIPTTDGRRVATVPIYLEDEPPFHADQEWQVAQEAIDAFIEEFAQTASPPELMAIQAATAYNRAAIRLAHMEDREPMLRRTGSNFLAALYIRTDQRDTPTVLQMYETFMSEAHGEFQQAAELFAQAPSLDASLRGACRTLALSGQAELEKYWGRDVARADTLQRLATVDVPAGDGSAILDALQSSPRIVLIIALPAPGF
jgi:hypothetical protein